jgi:hypothetical protein
MNAITYSGPIGTYSGTRAVGEYPAAGAILLITVDTVALHGGRWSLCGDPTRPVEASGGHPRPHVVASLERSLEKYADVWAELSRY